MRSPSSIGLISVIGVTLLGYANDPIDSLWCHQEIGSTWLKAILMSRWSRPVWSCISGVVYWFIKRSKKCICGLSDGRWSRDGLRVCIQTKFWKVKHLDTEHGLVGIYEYELTWLPDECGIMKELWIQDGWWLDFLAIGATNYCVNYIQHMYSE